MTEHLRKGKGRPPGAKNHKTIVKEIASETHSVTIDGGRKNISTIELALFELRNQMAKGNTQARRACITIIKKYETQYENEDAGVLVAPAEMTPEEWVKDQEEKNKTRTRPTSDYYKNKQE